MVGFPLNWMEVSLAAFGAAGAVAYPTFVPACAWWGPLVSHVPPSSGPRVAMTFDDGPLPGATDQVLDILGELNVKAAFFVIGRSVERHPDLVRRIHREGHLIGNHSRDHATWGFLRGRRFWREQLARTDAAIEQAIGLKPRLFRPPMGIKTGLMACAASDRAVITWSRRGFDGTATTSRRILQRLVPHAQPGDIIALHDGVSPQSRRDPSVTVAAVRPVITGLRGRGLEPVRLDELTGIAPYID